MTADRNAGDSTAHAITPIAFQPLGGSRESRRPRLRPALLAVFLLLGLALLALWFLLSARALVVTSEPADAQVALDGALILRLSDHYLLRPGQYAVSASAPGYREFQGTVTVTKAENQQLQLTLEKLPGHLQLSAISGSGETAAVALPSPSQPGPPDGRSTLGAGSDRDSAGARAHSSNDDIQAEIILDGIPRGHTPMQLRDLTPGQHQLTLRADRYFASSQVVAIDGMDRTQTLSISLRPAWGYLELATLPAGATVMVGDQVQGQTPLTAAVLETGETVSLSLAGYKPWRQFQAVPAGITRKLEPIILALDDGVVEVSSQPTGATLTLDDTYRGRTPLTLALAPDRDHLLQFYLEGHEPAERRLRVPSGSQQQITVALAPILASVQISTRPAGAALFIDGEPRGVDGDTLTLPARPHRLEVRQPGYAPVVQTITPRPGLQQVLQISLLTEAEARLASLPREVSLSNGLTLKLFQADRPFLMGSSRREPGRRANEVQRRVQLVRPFYLSTTEITNRAFKKFRASHSSSHASGVTLDLPDQPVVRVSWNDAALFCNWLSSQDGLQPFYSVADGRITGSDPAALGYRLPTEAEWAWAARFEAQDEALRYPWGVSLPPPAGAGNYADTSAAKIVGRIIQNYQDGFAAAAPVASFNANHRGLYDLGGNVAEWVNDFYGIEPDLGGAVHEDPAGPESGEFRVIRGASWRHGSLTELRLSFRDYGVEPRDDLGFRIARYGQ